MIVIIGYGVSFFFLSLTLNTIPVGIAYAIWSGTGIILISLIGYFFSNKHWISRLLLVLF
jgi:small multidrug resistance pump